LNNKLIFRSFNDEDYITIHKWWSWWWGKNKGIKREILPHNDYCYIMEKNDIPISAAFLYVDKHAPIGYLTFLVSNPEYREKDRKYILEKLILSIEEEAKSQDIKFMFTVCGNKHVENIHDRLGWTIDKSSPAYETFKYI
jgi:hypothetical protein